MRPLVSLVGGGLFCFGLFCFGLFWALPQAEAQSVCAEGRVRTSTGYCCWPGQRWDDAARRCDGPPRCPAPFVAAGAECVPSHSRGAGGLASSLTRPRVTAPRADVPRADVPRADGPRVAYVSEAVPTHPTLETDLSLWESSPERPAGLGAPVRERVVDPDVVIVGAVFLGFGYAGAIGMSVVAFEEGGRATPCYDEVGALSLIPVVGSLIAGITHPSCTVETPAYGVYQPRREGYSIVGAVTGGVQILGALMVAGALVFPGWKVSWNDEVASLRLTGSAGPDRALLGLRLDAF